MEVHRGGLMKYASITCTIHPSQVHGGLKEDCDVIAPVKAFMEVPVGKPTKEITVPLKLLPVILPVRRLEVHTTHVHPTSLPSPRKTQTRTCDMHYHRRVYCNNSGCGHHRASMVLSVGLWLCGCAGRVSERGLCYQAMECSLVCTSHAVFDFLVC